MKKTKFDSVVELKYGKGLSKRDRIPGKVNVYGSNGIIDSHNEHLLFEPAIIVGRKGSIGEVLFSKSPSWPIDTTYYITQKETSLDLKYLYYKLLTLNLTSMNTHAAVPGLNRNDVYVLNIFIPETIREQKAITKILSDLDSKIDLLQKQNRLLEQIGQAIFKQWFIDFDFPNEEEKPYKSSGGKMIESELGDIPLKWEVKNLGELIINYDSKRIPLSSMERKKKQGKYPYHGATKIMDYVNGFLFDGVYLLIAEDGSVTNKTGNPVLQYVRDKFWVSNHAHIIQGKVCSTEFIYLLLAKLNIEPYITGAVQPKLNQSNMNSIKVVFPSEYALEKGNPLIKNIFSKKLFIENEIKNLQKTKDLLLPKLMSGQIRVHLEVPT